VSHNATSRSGTLGNARYGAMTTSGCCADRQIGTATRAKRARIPIGRSVRERFSASVVSLERPKAIVYRQIADAFRSGDHARLASYIDENVVRRVLGSHTMAGDIQGRDDLLAWLARLSEKGFWLTEDDVFGNDDHVCALSIMGARRLGDDVQTRVVSVFTYRDGRQVERWFYPDDVSA